MFSRKSNSDGGSIPHTSVMPPELPTRPAPPLATSMRASAIEPPKVSSPQFEEGLVVIGKGTRVNGRITDCRVLDVHGIIEADVVTEKLIVRQGGGIKGTVQTDNAEIHGVLEGTLTVHEYLDIRGTAQVTGDVEYRKLAIEAGAQVRGSIMCSDTVDVASSTEPLDRMSADVVSSNGEPAQSNGAHRNGAEHFAPPAPTGGGHPTLQAFMPISVPPSNSDKSWRQTH